MLHLCSRIMILVMVVSLAAISQLQASNLEGIFQEIDKFYKGQRPIQPEEHRLLAQAGKYIPANDYESVLANYRNGFATMMDLLESERLMIMQELQNNGVDSQNNTPY